MTIPEYQCHKKIRAFKIKEIRIDRGMTEIIPEDETLESIQPSPTYMEKHKPKAGGYYVLYADGYASFSPAEPFEAGYTKVT